MKRARNTLFFLAAICALLAVAACAPLQAPAPQAEELTLYVGPELVDCVGVAPMQCMQVKQAADDEWQLFYDQIDGFTYEPGYTYELRVQRIAVPNPPADASAFRYELIEEVSRTPTLVVIGDENGLAGQEWQLQEIQMLEDNSVFVPADHALHTLNFSVAGEFNGQNDCNRISGSYVVDGSNITFANIVSTMAMCAPESLFERYMQALLYADSFTMEGDNLLIAFGPNVGVLKFGPAAEMQTQAQLELSATALENAEYQSIYTETITLQDGVYEGAPFVEGGAARPRVELIEPLIRLGDLNGDGVDDAVVVLVENSGGSGVFNYLAAVVDDAGEPSNVSTTLIGDRTQIKALQIVDGQIVLDIVTQGPDDAQCCPSLLVHQLYALENDELVQVSSEEQGMVSLDNLNGTSWVLTEMNGEAVESATAEITLVFKDGDIGGSSGCNTYRSSVAAKAGDAPQTIALTPPIVTRMMCPEPVMTLENNFLPRLGAVIQWGYMAGDLALLYQLDDEVGTLIFAPQPASE